MTLETTIKMNAFRESTLSNTMVVDLENAIEIAKRYAMEMCKLQRELCEKEYKRREAEYFEIGYDIELSSTGFSHEILNAPLATEEGE